MCLAVPGRVMAIDESGPMRLGKLDFGGVVQTVCLDLLPELAVGDYALVHVGVAISRLDEQTAQETLAALAQLAPDEP